MNNAHLHLLLNHLPIIFPMIGLLIFITGFLLKSELVKRIAYLVFIAGAVVAIPAFYTGEDAEEVVENLQDISKKMIHEHEEKAEVFAYISYLLGALSILGLWANWKEMKFSKLLSYLIGVQVLVVLFLGYQTGNSGGEIRHTEIRSDQTLDSSQNNPANDNDSD